MYTYSIIHGIYSIKVHYQIDGFCRTNKQALSPAVIYSIYLKYKTYSIFYIDRWIPPQEPGGALTGNIIYTYNIIRFLYSR